MIMKVLERTDTGGLKEKLEYLLEHAGDLAIEVLSSETIPGQSVDWRKRFHLTMGAGRLKQFHNFCHGWDVNRGK